MSAKRPAPKSPAATPAPLLNVVLLVLAIVYGLWLLVQRGRVSWPPHELLSSIYTLAGCLALVGPILLFRRESGGELGLGDLLWMTGGALVWIFDLAAVARGQWRTTSWATPLDALPMGLTMLAVLLAGWRARGAGRNWSWTNVTGWILGLFWVGMAMSALVPAGSIGLASR